MPTFSFFLYAPGVLSSAGRTIAAATRPRHPVLSMREAQLLRAR